MPAREFVSDFNSQVYCSICLTSTWNNINTSIQYNRANFFLLNTKERNCQWDQQCYLSQSAEMPSYMSGREIVGYYNSQTYCSICLTSSWNIINTSFSLIVLIFFYHIQGYVTVSVTYNPILASMPRFRRFNPSARMWMTLLIKHIVTYAWPQFEISLTHQI